MLVMSGAIKTYRKVFTSPNEKYSDDEIADLTVNQRIIANVYGPLLMSTSCEPHEPYTLGEDTLLNGRESTFSAITQTESIILYVNM